MLVHTVVYTTAICRWTLLFPLKPERRTILVVDEGHFGASQFTVTNVYLIAVVPSSREWKIT